MTLQIVITRTPDGAIKVIEMGLGERGHGETLRQHELRVSDPLNAKYIADMLGTLRSPGDTE